MIYVIGHKNPDTDSVVSAIAYAFLKGNGYKPLIAGKLNRETAFVLEKFNFEVPKTYKEDSNSEFILVDHNEQSQQVDNLLSTKIIGIIDHHKFNFQNNTPIDILAKPYGSTASIIAEQFFNENSNCLSANLAGILLCAILSDTVIFKSPTTTTQDKELAQKLAQIAEIRDIEALGIELFNKKAEIDSKTPQEIIKNDFKDFIFDKKKIGIGQIELIDLKNIKIREKEIVTEMNRLAKKSNYFSIILIITDIINEGSYLWVAENKEYVFQKLNIKSGAFLKGVLSRKKQIVPFFL